MQKKKITRIYIEGDSCSGKSTFLDSFEDKRFKIIREDGLKKIAKGLEDDKFLSIIWFSLYYYNREMQLKTKKIPIIEKSIIDEYPLLKIYPKLGKITKEEQKIGIDFVNLLVKRNPIKKTDLVIHFVCDYKTIKSRSEARNKKISKYHKIHWNFLRSATQKYFKNKCHYVKIDTTNLSKKQVKEKVIKIINKYVTKFWRRS